MIVLRACLVASLLGTRGASATGRIDGKLNVHLVCHTHDDAGWLKTVDQYFYGANKTITPTGVQYILDSVVTALGEDSERKFVYAEQAFLWRWWRQQGSERREAVRRLVSEGRLSFINGGWVMHDEAAAHYVGMVDQTHLGHAFLRREFGEEALPTVAWQIDPFGHSATQASLLGAQAGFDALYFGRIDYQDRGKRIGEKDMEMLWRASRSLEEEAQIFTGVFHSGNYGPPEGFCFDQYCQGEPMMTDLLMADYNVERRASEFADACQELGRNTAGEDVMLQIGGDFGFENANEWFKNLDILIAAVNEEGRVNAFYSTPQLYTEAKHASGVEFSVKKDDFFPYADCPHCYWTGYFSSRPGLKRLERVTSAYLQAARQLQALAGVGRKRRTAGTSGETREAAAELESLAALERAQALAQHHDAVTGTSRQHVADDYAQRLDAARAGVEGVVSAALSRAAFEGGDGGEGGLLLLQQCRLANVSTCDVTMEAESGFVAVAYSPLAQTRSGFVDVPISWPNAVVTDAAGNTVEAAVLPFRHVNLLRSLVARGGGGGRGGEGIGGGGDDAVGQQQQRTYQHPYTLMLPVGSAEPLEARVFHVEKQQQQQQNKKEIRDGANTQNGSQDREQDEGGLVRGQGGGRAGEGDRPRRRQYHGGNNTGATTTTTTGHHEDFSISSDLVTLTFDGATGRLARMETRAEGEGVVSAGEGGGEKASTTSAATTAALDVDQGWLFYPTFDGGARTRNGADETSSSNASAADGGNPTAGGERRQQRRQQDVSAGQSAAAEASRLHGELRERLDGSQNQKGGAYIFRPAGEGRGGATPVGAEGGGAGQEGGLDVKEWWVDEGPIVSEVHQVFSDWVTQTIRVRRGQAYAELDWAVGPIPVGASSSSSSSPYDADNDAGEAGKEVISRFSAPSVASEGTFYTDANGREFQTRVRDYRPTWDLNVTEPVAGNYYPVTAAAFVRDEGSGGDGMQLSVLTDRAQACSSLVDGELELLAHRRLLTEDQRGVGEALNETTDGMSHYPDWERRGDGEVFRGTHYLVVSRKRDAMKAVRSLMDEVFNPFVAAFGEENGEGGTVDHPLAPLLNAGDESAAMSSVLVETTHHTTTIVATTEEEAASTAAVSQPAGAGAAGGGGAVTATAISASSDPPPAGETSPQDSTTSATTPISKTTTATTAAAAAVASRTLVAGEDEEKAKEPTIEPACRTAGGGLLQALPANVGLMTLMRVADQERSERHDGASGSASPFHVFDPERQSEASTDGELTLLIRLAHRYAKGEDPVLSLPAYVDLSQLVLGHSLVEAEEIALTGGGSYSARKQRLKWTRTTSTTAATAAAAAADTATDSSAAGAADAAGAGAGAAGAGAAGAGAGDGDGDDDGGGGNKWTVALAPMEIKTYRLQLTPTGHRC